VPEPLATLREVADYLRLPPKTLYSWRYRGEGPPGIRVGRHVRYRWADVEGWLSAHVGEKGRTS
jgi:excisionase family DNA binding protein